MNYNCIRQESGVKLSSLFVLYLWVKESPPLQKQDSEKWVQEFVT